MDAVRSAIRALARSGPYVGMPRRLQFQFHFIPKMFSRVKVGVLCRTLQFLHPNLNINVFLELLCAQGHYHAGTVMATVAHTFGHIVLFIYKVYLKVYLE